MSPTPPSSKLLFGEWFALGLQSFGGGSSLILIHRAVVERHEWITEESFIRNWALSQLCPGINMIAFTLLCGRQIAGARGMILCLLAFLLPSVLITILLTAAYTHIRDNKTVSQALSAIIPASVGLGLLSAYNMSRDPLKKSSQEGQARLALSIALLVASAALMLFIKPPVFLLLLAGGAVMGLAFLWKARQEAP